MRDQVIMNPPLSVRHPSAVVIIVEQVLKEDPSKLRVGAIQRGDRVDFGALSVNLTLGPDTPLLC